MFFYLSFLRPPPIQAPLYGTVSITPQISNDLRTEPFQGSQDLYYSWAFETSPPDAPISTKPTKLTTWRPSSAYKAIPVPVPPNVREGQKWRLVLTCQPQQSYRDANIDLRESSIGLIPFPVVSLPVSFGTKKDGRERKQEMIERTYLFPFTQDELGVECTMPAFLRFLEKTSYDLDKKIWDSGIGLSSWTAGLKESNAVPESESGEGMTKLVSVLFSDSPCKIVELGAGIGMVSVALAVLRSAVSICQDSDAIYATDVHTAMPLLKQNIAANARYYLSGVPQPLVLDWDDEILPPEICELGGLDIIMMADVSYNTSSFPALSRTISNLVRLGSDPPLIVLGYKERDEAERTFWDMMTQIGIHFEKVGERRGAGSFPVEIWLGSYSSNMNG